MEKKLKTENTYQKNSKNQIDNTFYFNSGLLREKSNSFSDKDEIKTLPKLLWDQYSISKEPFTEITKIPQETLKYIQNIGVRYLEPPEAEKPGDLIIRQLPDKQYAQAPPVFIKQTPPRPKTPTPLIIREQPPIPLPKIERQVIEIPGKTLPPPPRRVIVEKLPPIPPKPRTIIIDKWLPQKQQKRKIIFEKVSNKTLPYQSQKNILINWKAPNVEVERKITNLGVFKVDPKDYTEKYANSFSHNEEIKEILESIKIPNEFDQRKSHMTRSSRSLYKNDSFDLESTKNFAKISHKKRVSFQT